LNLRSGTLAPFVVVVTAAAVGSAHAFDTKGHAVIEALAYRTLVEGHGAPARHEVLRDLINDGALGTPWCFGRGNPLTGECKDAWSDNPLLFWPEPESDRPDLFFRRQLLLTTLGHERPAVSGQSA
jgi:hypothetical protein